MEHRCSERVNTDLKILIYKMGTPVAIGRIKNGSKLGLFIETDFADVNMLQSLDVEVVLSRTQQQLTKRRYTAQVVRKTPKGLGLELEYLGSASREILTALLSASAPQESRHEESQRSIEKPRAVKPAKVAQMN